LKIFFIFTAFENSSGAQLDILIFFFWLFLKLLEVVIILQPIKLALFI